MDHAGDRREQVAVAKLALKDLADGGRDRKQRRIECFLVWHDVALTLAEVGVDLGCEAARGPEVC